MTIDMNKDEQERYIPFVFDLLNNASLLLCPTQFTKEESGFVKQHLLIKLLGLDMMIVGNVELEIPWAWLDEGKESVSEAPSLAKYVPKEFTGCYWEWPNIKDFFED